MRNKWERRGDSIVIQVFDYREQMFRECFIDEADMKLVERVGTWCAHRVRGKALKWYAIGKLWSKEDRRPCTVLMHRFVLGLTDPEVEADHRDNNGLNNRRLNLRACTHQENIRFKQPEKDWARYDRIQRVVAMYRLERSIAKEISGRFGIKREAMYKMRNGHMATTPAALAYALACAAAECPTYISLKLEYPVSSAKWGATLAEAA